MPGWFPGGVTGLCLSGGGEEAMPRDRKHRGRRLVLKLTVVSI